MKGRLGIAELARLRVKYFSCGLVLGSQEYVQRVWEAQRQRFGTNRARGARLVMESEVPLFTLGRLR